MEFTRLILEDKSSFSEKNQQLQTFCSWKRNPKWNGHVACFGWVERNKWRQLEPTVTHGRFWFACGRNGVLLGSCAWKKLALWEARARQMRVARARALLWLDCAWKTCTNSRPDWLEKGQRGAGPCMVSWRVWKWHVVACAWLGWQLGLINWAFFLRFCF